MLSRPATVWAQRLVWAQRFAGSGRRFGSVSRPTVGLLNPVEVWEPFLAQVLKDFDVRPLYLEIVQTPAAQTLASMKSTLARCHEEGIESVWAFGDPLQWPQLWLNAALGSGVGVSALSMLFCQSKCLQRTLLRDVCPHFWFSPFDPFQENNETVLRKVREFPCIVKKCHARGGSGTFKVHSATELNAILHWARSEPTNEWQRVRSNWKELVGELPSEMSPFVCQQMVDLKPGITEYTWEGYVSPTGQIVDYMLTEEVFAGEKQQLVGYLTPPRPQRLDPKSKTGRRVLAEIQKFTRLCVEPLVEMGFRQSFLNVELFVDDDSGHCELVEINGRTAAPYVTLYNQTFGRNLLQDNARLIAFGECVPPSETPWNRWVKNGTEKFALAMYANAGPQHAGMRVDQVIDTSFLGQLQKDEAKVVVNKRFQNCSDVFPEQIGIAGEHMVELTFAEETFEDVFIKERRLRSALYKSSNDTLPPDYTADLLTK